MTTEQAPRRTPCVGDLARKWTPALRMVLLAATMSLGCRSTAQRDVARVEPSIGRGSTQFAQATGPHIYTFPGPGQAVGCPPASPVAVAATPMAAAPAVAAAAAPVIASPVVAAAAPVVSAPAAPVLVAGAPSLVPPPYSGPTTGSSFVPGAGVAVPGPSAAVVPGPAPMNVTAGMRLQPSMPNVAPQASPSSGGFLGDEIQPAGFRLHPSESGGGVRRADLTTAPPRSSPPAARSPSAVPAPPDESDILPRDASPGPLRTPPPPPVARPQPAPPAAPKPGAPGGTQSDRTRPPPVGQPKSTQPARPAPTDEPPPLIPAPSLSDP